MDDALLETNSIISYMDHMAFIINRIPSCAVVIGWRGDVESTNETALPRWWVTGGACRGAIM